MTATNKAEIAGVIKWEPNVFPPRTQDQKPIMVFAVEFTNDKSARTSVFHIKAYGDLAETLQNDGLAQGDSVTVHGALNEAKWKDKRTDEWKSRVEIWAREVNIVERAGAMATVAAGTGFDDIPF